MSISIVNVVVPSSGDGPIANIANLVGKKTVELSGTFRGKYILLGTQNGLNFVPVAIFDSNGVEAIKQTLELALSAVRLRCEATNPSNVTMNVSGVLSVGGNQFTTIATIPAGATGRQPIIDLDAVFPPTGVEQDICFLCEGSFGGALIVEGSLDGTNFNPIGSGFTGGSQLPSLLGNTEPLEFSPLTTTDLIRYLRVTLTGVATSQVVVTFGGSNPATGGGSTVPIPYLVSDNSATAYQGAGTGYGVFLGANVLIAGSGNAASNVNNSGIVVVGSGNSIDHDSLSSVIMGQGNTIKTQSARSTVLGTSSVVGDSSPDTICIDGNIGDNAQSSILLGRSTIGAFAGARAAANLAMGTTSAIDDGSVNVILLGNANHVFGTTANDAAVVIGTSIVVKAGSPATIAMGNGAAVGVNSPNAFVVAGNLGDNAPNCVIIGASTIGSTGGSRATGNTVVGTSSTIGDGSVDVILIGNGSTITGPSDATILIGKASSIGTGSPSSIALGIQATIGTYSHDTLCIGGALGDNAPSSILIGRSQIGVGGGTRAPSNILVGTSSTISDNSADVIVIGNGSSSTASDATIVIGKTSSIATGSPSAIALGIQAQIGQGSYSSFCVGGVLGDNAHYSILIGDSGSTIGTLGGNNAPSNILIGTSGSSISDAALNNILIGTGSSITLSDFTVAIGANVTISGGVSSAASTNAVAIGKSSTIGSSSQSAVCILGTTGNTSPGSLNVNGTIGNGNPDVVNILGQIGDNCNGSIAIGSGNSIGPTGMFSTIVGQSNSIGDLTHGATGYIFGDNNSIANAVLEGIIIGLQSSVTGTCGIAIGSYVTAIANQCVIGNGLPHAVDTSIHDFTVNGNFGGVSLYTIRAVDNPVAHYTGLTVVYNDATVTTNKNVRALASPPANSLLLFIDP